MGFFGTNRETFEFIIWITGAVLAVFALLWWFIAAILTRRKRGPVVLGLLGVLLAIAPFTIHALNGRVVDLGRPVQILDGDVSFHLKEPGGIDLARVVDVEAVVAIAGLVFISLAVVWLMLRTLEKENWPRVRWPVFLLIFAIALVALPFVANAFIPKNIDLGPRLRTVDGEVHLTLTGWDQKDYSILRTQPQTVVLQMANPDVTDATLKYLKGMDHLHELDLSNSAVTDAGLVSLQNLPLEKLRLARTKVTDAGFKDHLASIETLKMLDLSGTAVSAETIDAWKKSKPGRKALH